MKNIHLIPHLFADCIFVKGAKRALLCDLSRKAYLPLNLTIYSLFVEHKGKSLAEFYEVFEA